MRCGACAERGARREACAVAYVDFHLTVETVAEQKVVRHTDAMRLHRVALAIVILAGRRAAILQALVRAALHCACRGSAAGTHVSNV